MDFSIMKTKPARVTVKVKLNLNEKTIYKAVEPISSNLPQYRLGEMVGMAVDAAWKAGNNPCDFHVIVHFR